jgi:hypothetical protein
MKTERRRPTGSGSSKSLGKTRPPSAHENKGFPKFSISSSSRRDDPTQNYVPRDDFFSEGWFGILPVTPSELIEDTFADGEPLGDGKTDMGGEGTGLEG